MGGQTIAEINLPKSFNFQANKDVLKAEKVRSTIKCALCQKTRVIYSQSSLTPRVEEFLRVNAEESDFCCGAPLVRDDCEYVRQTAVVRRQLNCKSPIEAAYYSAKKLHLPLICCCCGSTSGAKLKEDDHIEELKRTHQVVR